MMDEWKQNEVSAISAMFYLILLLIRRTAVNEPHWAVKPR